MEKILKKYQEKVDNDKHSTKDAKIIGEPSENRQKYAITLKKSQK